MLLSIIVFALESDEKIEFIKTTNTKIHNSIKYGPGLPGPQNEKELLAYGEGHCGDYSYLLARELKKYGFNTRIVGIRSSYKNAAHSRVEVKINGKWNVLDPTFNIFFPNSIQELIDNPDLVDFMQGIPSTTSAYNDKDFFRNAKYIEYVYDIDGIDKNIATLGTITSETDFSILNYELSKMIDQNYITFSAANTYTLPQSFTIEFDGIQEFYRIKIAWYSNTIYGQDFSIEFLDPSDNQFKQLINEVNYIDSDNDGVYEYILQDSIKTNKVRFNLLKAYGQSRTLIREFMIFE